MQSSISEPQISDLVAFNRQLKRSLEVGIPLRWPADHSTTDLLSGADIAIKDLAFRVTQGAELRDALRESTSVPEAYKLSFLAWFESGRSPRALDLLKGLEFRSPMVQLGEAWYFCLKILIVLAGCALLLWQFNGGSALANLYDESNLQPGPIGRTAIYIQRDLLGQIFSAPNLLLFLALFAVPTLLYYWFRPRNHAVSELNLMNAANSSALYGSLFVRTLLNSGIPIERAVALKETMVPPSNPLSENMDLAGQKPEMDPLLYYAKEWGLERKLNRVLKQSSLQRPYLIYVLVGGVVVLILALLVFVPTFEFIYSSETNRDL